MRRRTVQHYLGSKEPAEALEGLEANVSQIASILDAKRQHMGDNQGTATTLHNSPGEQPGCLRDNPQMHNTFRMPMLAFRFEPPDAS